MGLFLISSEKYWKYCTVKETAFPEKTYEILQPGKNRLFLFCLFRVKIFNSVESSF